MPEPISSIVGIDIGTSSIRCVVCSTSGEIIQTVHAPRKLNSHLTFDPQAMWAGVCAATRSCLSKTRNRLEILAVGVAAHVGTVTLGRPTRGYGWANAVGVEKVAGVLTGADAFEPTGRVMVTPSALAILASMAPAERGDIEVVMSPKDWIVFRMTGIVATDQINAAYTLMFDVRHRRWSDGLRKLAGLCADQLPPVVGPSEIVGVIDARAAEATGIPSGIPVVSGAPDGTSGVIGTAATRDDVIVDIAGTTDAIFRVRTTPERSDPSSVVNPYVSDALWIHGGPTGLTGGAHATLAEVLGSPTLAEAAISGEWPEIPAGALGLIVDQHATGARFPLWDTARGSSIIGLRPEHTPAHIVRAIHEAAAYTVRMGVDTLTCGDADLAVAMSGGASRSDAVVQLRADVLGRTVVAFPPEASVVGAIALAGTGAGIFDDLDEAAATVAAPRTVFEPDPARTELYERLFNEWCQNFG